MKQCCNHNWHFEIHILEDMFSFPWTWVKEANLDWFVYLLIYIIFILIFTNGIRFNLDAGLTLGSSIRTYYQMSTQSRLMIFNLWTLESTMKLCNISSVVTFGFLTLCIWKHKQFWNGKMRPTSGNYKLFAADEEEPKGYNSDFKLSRMRPKTIYMYGINLSNFTKILFFFPF